MKTLLLILIVMICVIGWRGSEITEQLGLQKFALKPQAITVQSLVIPADKASQNAMSLTDYAREADSNPHAYRQLLQGNQQDEERREVDKLINLFTRGKYE
jgi:hypothetical protein